MLVHQRRDRIMGQLSSSGGRTLERLKKASAGKRASFVCVIIKCIFHGNDDVFVWADYNWQPPSEGNL